MYATDSQRLFNISQELESGESLPSMEVLALNKTFCDPYYDPCWEITALVIYNESLVVGGSAYFEDGNDFEEVYIYIPDL